MAAFANCSPSGDHSEMTGRPLFAAALGAVLTGLPSASALAAENLLPQAAQSVGVRQCLPAIARLSELAISNSRSHDVLIDWDRAQPDAGPFFSLLGIAYGPNSVAATITA